MTFSSGDFVAVGACFVSVSWGWFVWWDNKQDKQRRDDHDNVKRITQQNDSLDTVQDKLKDLSRLEGEVSESHYALRDAFLRHEATCDERGIRIDDNISSIKRTLENVQAQIANIARGAAGRLWEIKPGE